MEAEQIMEVVILQCAAMIGKTYVSYILLPRLYINTVYLLAICLVTKS